MLYAKKCKKKANAQIFPLKNIGMGKKIKNKLKK